MSITDRLRLGLRDRVPVILQAEAAECGIACLAMVASFHGHRLDLPAIRQRFSMSLTGMTLRDLMGVAGRLGLTPRPLRAGLNALGKLRLPAILHWDFNHFVVLTAWRGRGGAVVHDPATGRKVLPLAEVSQHYTGVALELTPSVAFAASDERAAVRLRDLLGRVRGLGRAAGIALVLSFALEAFQVLVPIGSQLIIDQALVAADYDLVRLVAVALGLAILMQAATTAARSWGLMVVSATLAVQWSASLFDHLVRLPLGFFEKRHVGDVLSRFQSLEIVRDTLSAKFLSSLVDGVMAVGLLAMMALYGGWLSLVVCATSAFYLAMRLAVYGPYRRAAEELIVRRAREESHFLETLRGATTVKVFGLEQRRGAAWLNLFVDRLNAGVSSQKLDILYTACRQVLFGLDRVLLLLLGADRVIAGSLSLGMLVAFLAYKDQFTTRVGNLVDAAIQLRMLRLQSERLADLALTDAEMEHAPPASLRQGPRAVALHGITFRYGEAQRPVLAGFDLHVARGQCVAIAGPSGCGKTTLLKIAAGLLRPDSGEILVDGAPLTPATLASFRSGTACVMQDDRLFAGSLLDNITAFDPHADMERVRLCTAAAAVEDDIAHLPMGMETLVGDMGSALSGGQRQRLLLARALYRQPGLLLLDEPTNHLDEASASRVIDMLGQLGCTRIIVTHDERMMRIADHVVRLEPPGDRQMPL